MEKKSSKTGKQTNRPVRIMQGGFTIPELLVVMGIIGILFGFTTINLFHAQNASELNTTVDTLISDMKSQQIQAMTGDTQGSGVTSSYGIYFTNNQYVLFRGSSYNPSDPTNRTIALGSNLVFSSDLFPSNTIVFLKPSGEVSGFSAQGNSITLQTVNGAQQKTISINQYGVVIGAQ